MSRRPKDAEELANTFLTLNADGFRRFWSTVLHEWTNEVSDIEAMWFHFGKTMSPREIAAISALHAAACSGQKAARS